jgi:hypothetical protein
MAEHATIVEGDSPEAVAYALLFSIAVNEDKVQWGYPSTVKADAEWVLENYRRCLRATKGLLDK